MVREWQYREVAEGRLTPEQIRTPAEQRAAEAAERRASQLELQAFIASAKNRGCSPTKPPPASPAFCSAKRER